MKLIANNDPTGCRSGLKDAQLISLANDVDPRTQTLAGVGCVELHFPKFTDGRAFSQAFLLSRRLGFKGDIRATGDVLVDQLAQMRRCGFTSAVLRADQPLGVARQVLDAYPGCGLGVYQGDAVSTFSVFPFRGNVVEDGSHSPPSLTAPAQKAEPLELCMSSQGASA